MTTEPVDPLFAFQSQEEPPRKKSNVFWLLLLLIPAGLVGLALLVVGFGLLFELTAKEEAVSPAEREMVLDAEELAEWLEDFTPDSEHEVIKKRRYIDRSFEIDYEYDNYDNDGIYINCNLTVEHSLSDAQATYLSFWGGSAVEAALFSEDDIELAERNDLFKWGDQSKFAILKSEGESYGNQFIARKGKRVFYIVISGVYFDDAESISQLLTPALTRMENYRP